MLESEDFDLDEDFLKDIGEKEEEYYSQKNNDEAHQMEIITQAASKRRKTESHNFDLLTDITFDDEPDFARDTKKLLKDSLKIGLDENSPKNGIINENSTTRNSKWINNENYAMTNVEISRKSLALEIMKKGSVSATKRHNDEKIENFSHPRATNDRLNTLSSEGERNSQFFTEPEQVGRKILLERFKKPSKRSNSASKELPKFSSRDRSIAAPPPPRTTLVRKFPGPAGLLPDCPEANLDNGIFLNRLDNNSTSIEIDKDRDDSPAAAAADASEYCSQNTERLFSVGAWRAMLDDLPNNYLKGHEIATIKKIAKNESSCSGGNTRVSFLAGLIQRIDHSLENPRIELKDLSDSIEGTMHGDIPIAHPNILEPGVVILLRGAGLLGFQGSLKFPGIQFHLMIAPKNLLAVYTEKSRLIISPMMKSIINTADGCYSEKKAMAQDPLVSSKFCQNISTIESNVDKIMNNSEITSQPINIEISEFEADDNDNVNADESTARQMAEKMIVDRSTASMGEETQTENDEMRRKKISPIRSRLLDFRSKDVLTPSMSQRDERINDKLIDNTKHLDIPRENGEKEKEQYSSCSPRGFGENLLVESDSDNDNDTEDEILSQLDVDFIVTSYNSGNN